MKQAGTLRTLEKTMFQRTCIALALGLTVTVCGAQTPGHSGPRHGHDARHLHAQGQHDEVNMPGLQGKDTTPQEVNDLRVMFQLHKDFRRTVTHLPNGIRTVTETDNPRLYAALVSHVAGMLQRVSEQRNPHVIIQSPTLEAVFEGGRLIRNDIQVTAKGVTVTQTSDQPHLVKALQTHANEVSELALRGMAAVHEQMQGRHHRH